MYLCTCIELNQYFLLKADRTIHNMKFEEGICDFPTQEIALQRAHSFAPLSYPLHSAHYISRNNSS